jgi:hypothetical protein
MYIGFPVCSKAMYECETVSVKKTDAECLRTTGFRPRRGSGRKLKFA